MGCLAAEDHERIIRRIRFRHLKLHVILAGLLVISLYLPYHLKIERDLLQAENCSLKTRHRMLEMLRKKAAHDRTGYGHNRCGDAAE